MCSESGKQGLSLSGFVEDMIADVPYYVMKSGNLNIPWLTFLSHYLEGNNVWKE